MVHKVSLPQVDGELREEHSCQAGQSERLRVVRGFCAVSCGSGGFTHLSVGTGFLEHSGRKDESCNWQRDRHSVLTGSQVNTTSCVTVVSSQEVSFLTTLTETSNRKMLK